MTRRRVIAEAFNQTDEVHAFVNGAYKALFTANPKPKQPDSVDEVHYWRGGYIVGQAVQVTAALVILNTGLNI